MDPDAEWRKDPMIFTQILIAKINEGYLVVCLMQ